MSLSVLPGAACMLISHNVAFCVTGCSLSGGQVLLGMEDGSIRIQTLQTPHDLADPGAYWCLPMHDAQTGRVRSLALTYEQTQLLSVGDDGNFFLFNYMANEELQKRIAEYKAKLPSARVRGHWAAHGVIGRVTD